MTLTLNPLMGNLSSTYTVIASRALTLSSCFDFNFYSYESELKLGLELWRKKRPSLSPPPLTPTPDEKKNITNDINPPPPPQEPKAEPTPSGVLKAKLDHRGALALLWEARAKHLLYSCGVIIDARRGEGMLRSLGIEISYSS